MAKDLDMVAMRKENTVDYDREYSDIDMQIRELYLKSSKGKDFIHKNYEQLRYIRSMIIWYPDLFLKYNKPTTGGIDLYPDQALFLRGYMRHLSMTGVYSRSYSKTFLEILGMFLKAMVTPAFNQSLMAQTQRKATELLAEKHKEIIKFYPFFKDEIQHINKNKDIIEIIWKNGSSIDTMGIGEGAKGTRKHAVTLEESALLKSEEDFNNNVAPVVDESRRTLKHSKKHYQEAQNRIDFFTTAGFKGTSEYDRTVRALKSMAKMDGTYFGSADYRLAMYFERGISKSALEKRRKNYSHTAWLQNYMSTWVGNSVGGLVDTQRILNARTIEEPELQYTKERDTKNFKYYLGVDVARSENETNNQGSISVGKAYFNSDSFVNKIDIINILPLPNTDSFEIQALKIKKVESLYQAEAVVVDGQGLGIGLIDELMKVHTDEDTDIEYPAYNTLNTEKMPISNNYADKLFVMKSSKADSSQNDILSTFMGAFSSGKVKLLKPYKGKVFEMQTTEDILVNELPFIETDFLIEEIFNLKLIINGNSKLSIVQRATKINKDRFSALSYLLWYILEKESGKDYMDDDTSTSIYTSLFN
jgi:ribonucleoside-diphosphate reductase alpha chain